MASDSQDHLGTAFSPEFRLFLSGLVKTVEGRLMTCKHNIHMIQVREKKSSKT